MGLGLGLAVVSGRRLSLRKVRLLPRTSRLGRPLPRLLGETLLVRVRVRVN